MATIAKRFDEKTIASKAEVKASRRQKFLEEAQYNYFFLISFVILVGSCWGGITAMMVLKANAPTWQLCLNIYATMASNIASIGQAPAKWVLRIFGLSVLVNLVLLLLNVSQGSLF
jgi:hypothetical protein